MCAGDRPFESDPLASFLCCRRKLRSRPSTPPPQHADVATSYRWELYGERAMQPDGSIIRCASHLFVFAKLLPPIIARWC